MTEQEWEQLKNYIINSGLSYDDTMKALQLYQANQQIGQGG